LTSTVPSPDALARIDRLYDARLKPRLDAIDDWRRQVRWLIVKSVIVVAPPLCLLFAGDLLDGILPISGPGAMVLAGLWAVAGVIFAGVRYLLPGVTAYANYRSRFKRDVVAEIFKVVWPDADYDPVQGITAAVFDAPGLFNTRGSFQSDDRVRGRIGGTPFEASEVGRAYSTGTGRSSRTYVVFRGLFFHVAFNQRLRGTVVIEPTQAQSFQRGARDALSPVSFDDRAFEKEFAVHASIEAEARALLTPVLRAQLLTLQQQLDRPVFLAFTDRRAYVGVHYGRPLFEPGVAVSTSKAAVREIAGHFALVETIIRELTRHAPGPPTEPDDSLLRGADVEPHPLTRLAADKAGTLTTSDVWTMATAAIDDSAGDAGVPAPRPEGTRIRVERGPRELSITYGLRLGFWVMFGISLSGALLAASALRAAEAPEWVGAASVWARRVPSIAWLDAFAAEAPTPWLIVGTLVAGLFALAWTGYVHRVVIEIDRILIYRGFRPVPRLYRRPPYGRVLRLGTALYIGRSEGVRLMNPTASPMLTEPEARWLTAEIKRVL
jgi:hypothetical protein